MKTRVTIESLTVELDNVRDGAVTASQFGPARAAIETKARLHGLLVDRKETGQPGDFAGLTTPEQVIAAIRAELGEEAARLLEAATSPRPDDAAPVLADLTPSGSVN